MRHRLIRNGVLATSQVVITTGAMFIVYRMVTHRFGLQLLGVWSSASALSALASLGDCGLSDVMVRQVAEAIGQGEWHKARALHSALSRLALLGLAVAAGIAAPLIYGILQPAVPTPLGAAFPQIVAGAVCVSVLTNMTTAQFGVLEAFGMYGRRIVLALGAALIMIAVSWFCVHTNRPDAVAVIFISGGVWSSLGGYVIGRGLLARRSRLKYRVSFVELVRIFRIAVPIRMAGLLNLGLDPITRAALARYAGVEAAALYEIAYRVIFQLRAAIVSGLQTIVPYLSSTQRSSGTESRSTVLTAAGIAISAGTPIFALAVLGMPALSIMVTARSSPAVGWYAAILAVAWMINVASAPGYFANIVEGRVHRNWVSQGILCGVNAGLANSWPAQGKAATEQWSKWLGIDVTWYDGGLSIDKQRKAVDDMATKNWDFVAIQALGIDTLLDPVSQMIQKGIPVVQMDTIIAKNDEVRKQTVFATRRQAEETAKNLEHLRDNLAHAQDILATDWDTIVQICEFINLQ